MKVALVSFDFGEYCIRLANGLSEFADVKLIMPDCLISDHIWALDARVQLHSFEKPRLRQALRQIGLMRRLNRLIKKFAPDVVHIQGTHLWLSLTTPFLSRYPMVCTIHDPSHHAGDQWSRKSPQSIVDFGYRRADHAIVHAKELVAEVIDRFAIPRENIHVIPHIAIGERPGMAVVEEDPNQILFFGRIWEYKGLEYLIRAEPIISREFPKVKIVVAGRGEDISKYQQMVVNPQNVIWENRWIDEDERVRFFQQSSIVVLPYIEATQSGVVPNAYTFSKPVVATLTGGLPDCVDHERTGLLVPPRDENALAQAVIRLMKDAELRQKMGRAGRAKLDAECSPRVVAKQTIDVYRQAMGMPTAADEKIESQFDRRETEPVV